MKEMDHQALIMCRVLFRFPKNKTTICNVHFLQPKGII